MEEMPFFRIGSAADIPSDGMKTLAVLGRRIGVFRAADGALQAMEVTCRHQGGDLTLGTREGDVVTCPRHGWRYDLRTGECLNEPWARLRRFAVKIENGDVYLSSTPLSDTPA